MKPFHVHRSLVFLEHLAHMTNVHVRLVILRLVILDFFQFMQEDEYHGCGAPVGQCAKCPVVHATLLVIIPSLYPTGWVVIRVYYLNQQPWYTSFKLAYY